MRSAARGNVARAAGRRRAGGLAAARRRVEGGRAARVEVVMAAAPVL